VRIPPASRQARSIAAATGPSWKPRAPSAAMRRSVRARSRPSRRVAAALRPRGLWRQAVAQHPVGEGGLPADRGEAVADRELQRPGDGDPGLGRRDRGLEHLRELERAEHRVRRAQPGDRARHRRRERALLRAHPLGVGEAVVLHRLRASILNMSGRAAAGART
jgi:hypothetical protein